MTSDEQYEIKCPVCGEKKRIRKVIDQYTFDEPTYKNQCMNCGKTFI